MNRVPSELVGERFSQNYMQSTSLAKDSDRMRRRLAALFDKEFKENGPDFARFLIAEVGVEIKIKYFHGDYITWKDFFGPAELRDVLDSVTLGVRFIFGSGRSHSGFASQCSRIFQEEGVGFFLDERGGVHPSVDGAFDKVRVSALAVLSGPSFTAARVHVEKVDQAMLSTPMDGRQAIRSVFDLIENIFKQTFPRETQLNSKAINHVLSPKVQKGHCDGSIEQRVSLKQIEGLKIWVDSAHFFRHESGKPEVEQPSQDFSIHMISLGYSYARWLVQLLLR